MPTRLPRIAVLKFASCDGCQLSLLDCEEQLLALPSVVEIASFPEASRATATGPYDITLVEGSITTPHDAERIHAVRKATRSLVTIGACATSGGIQSLRNFANVQDYVSTVYATPGYIQTLSNSTPIADHVTVDFELRGCPVNKTQLLEVITALLHHRRPNVPAHSVCVECKLNGAVCVMVAQGKPCMGPITHAGCGALCPRYNRACYGCFGPSESPNTESFSRACSAMGMSKLGLLRSFRTYNAQSPAFCAEGDKHER